MKQEKQECKPGTRHYGSRAIRAADPPRFQMTERDIEILRALNRCRYLRTGQIGRVAFPDNTTLQSTRRRLRYLFHHGFIGRVQPFVRAGETPAEEAFYLDVRGIEFLMQQGDEVISGKRSGQVRPEFLHHALAVSEFRLNVEEALAGHAAVELETLVCDFAIRPHMERATGRERHVLYEKITDPGTADTYEFYPDLLVLMRGRGQYADRKQLLFVEVDCGTMSLQRLRRKVVAYHLYREAGLFRGHGADLPGFTVLIQTTTPKRVENLQGELAGTLGAPLVWTADAGKISAVTILTGPIWTDHAGKARQVLR